MLMGISDYSRNPGQGRNFPGRALRITAGYYDLAIGVLTLNPPNGSARVLISGGRDGTGIQNDNIGFVHRRCWFEPTIYELPLYSGAIRLRRSTAKILYVKARHSHIVT